MSLLLDWLLKGPNAVRQWYWPEPTESVITTGPFGLSGVLSISIGILLTLIGALCSSLGSIYEAWSTNNKHTTTETNSNVRYRLLEMDDECSERYVCGLARESTVIGLLIWLGGALVHVFGLFFAPASLLGPVNTSGLVFTLLLSRILLKDVITWKMTHCVTGIMGGIAICLFACTISTVEVLTLEQRETLYTQSWSSPIYLTYCLVLILLVTYIAFDIRTLNAEVKELRGEILRLKPQYATGRGIDFHVDENCVFGQHFRGSERYQLLQSISSRMNRLRNLTGERIAWIAGILGSQTVCQIKECEAHWTLTQFYGYSSLLSPGPIFAFVFLLVSAVVQFPLISDAFDIVDSETHTSVAACYHVVWTLFSVFGGFFKFHEYKQLSTTTLTIFCIGLFITLFATYLAAQNPAPRAAGESGKIFMSFNVAPFWNRFASSFSFVKPILNKDAQQTEEQVEMSSLNLQTSSPN